MTYLFLSGYADAARRSTTTDTASSGSWLPGALAVT